MQKFSVTEVAAAQLQLSRGAHAGRSSSTLLGGHDHSLRHTVVALLGGQVMDIENGPHEATLLVLTGSVEVSTAEDRIEVFAEQLVGLPEAPHTIVAREDMTALLTVSKGEYPN